MSLWLLWAPLLGALTWTGVRMTRSLVAGEVRLGPYVCGLAARPRLYWLLVAAETFAFLALTGFAGWLVAARHVPR